LVSIFTGGIKKELTIRTIIADNPINAKTAENTIKNL